MQPQYITNTIQAAQAAPGAPGVFWQKSRSARRWTKDMKERC